MTKKINSKKAVIAYFISLRKNLSAIKEIFVEKRIIDEYNENLEELEDISGYDLNKLKVEDEELITKIHKNGTVIVPGYETYTATTTYGSDKINIYRDERYYRLQLLTKLDTLLIIFRKDIESLFEKETI